MTVQISDFCRNALVAGATFAEVFSGGKIEIYTGELPASADTAPSAGSKLGEIKASDNSAPSYEMSPGAASLTSSKTWQLKATAVGLPTFARITGGTGNTSAMINTDQLSIPEITSTTAAIEITLFYFTLAGQG